MKAKRPWNKSHLLTRQGFLHEESLRQAYLSLVCRVFGQDEVTDPRIDDLLWWPFSAFEPSGRCVATVESRRLNVLLGGSNVAVAGLRRVAVDPEWRGLGLLRDLMGPAFRWCEATSDGLVLLYTEEPAIYERFGFVTLPQYAVVGPCPPLQTRNPSARRLDISAAEDRALIDGALARRAPLSMQCALIDAPDLLWRRIQSADDLELAYAADLDALIVFEDDDGQLTLVDVVAPAIPSMSAIVASLGLRPDLITTLFPPDRLGWSGQARIDDTGLMRRGLLPPEMTRPFMLPPTAEF